jgi:hypothetical protein
MVAVDGQVALELPEHMLIPVYFSVEEFLIAIGTKAPGRITRRRISPYVIECEE